jgi:hypothetical protein
MEDSKKINCNKCRCCYYLSDFVTEGRRFKTCIKCRNFYKESRIKNYCIHERERYRCKECYGAGICKHNNVKSFCKQCDDSQICKHERIKYQCKPCGGSQICVHQRRRYICKECSDPIEISIQNWIKTCRFVDKKSNTYDPDHFIDRDFLEGLIEDYKFCYYEDCKVSFEYIEYSDNLVTIERINNNIGHIKSNCVLCCFKCNRKKKSNTTTISIDSLVRQI